MIVSQARCPTAWRPTILLEAVNWMVLALSLAATWTCLWIACHEPVPVALMAAVAFALMNFTPFALLHEAVHDLASPSRRRNRLLGNLAAVALPTSFDMQRIAHLGHHRRNRTDAELYDYYLPHEKVWLRNVWLYAGNLFGLYWVCIPLLGLVYLLAPSLFRSRFFVERVAASLGFGPYVAELAEVPVRQVWRQVAFSFAYQAAVFVALGLDWDGWLLCHWFFALYWSALQYVDHAWSPRDVMRGAWNLKVATPVRWLGLHYHYHLAHHERPDVPWIHLPRLVSRDGDTPSFWAIYRSLWKGVRPAPPMGAPANRAIFE